jgi:anti-anti-sigma regulatory factor
VLVGVQGRARARGITLALTGLPPRVAQLLHITGLNRRFPIVVRSGRSTESGDVRAGLVGG